MGQPLAEAYVKINLDQSPLKTGLPAALNTLQAWHSKVKKYATIAITVTGVAAAAKGFKSVVDTTAEFEQAMAMVKSVTGANEEQFAALREKAEELGRTSRWTMTEIASGMEFLGRAGFSTQEIIAAIGPVSDLAASQMMDFGRAADIATNILTGMKLPAEEAGRVADVLAATAASANVNVEMLGESFKYWAPVASTFGISLEESAAMIGRLGDAGLQGSIATAALATAFSRLTKPTEQMEDVMAELNLHFFDAQGNFIGLIPMIEQLENAFQGLSQEEKMSALSTIFGARAMKQIAVLLDVGSEGLAEYVRELEGAGGSAQEMAEIQLDTLQGQLTVLKGSWDLLKVTIGKEITPVLQKFVQDTLIPLVNGIADWIDKMGGLSGIAETVKGKIADLVGGVENFQAITEAAKDVVSAAWEAVKGAFNLAKDALSGGLKAIVSLLRGDFSGAWEAVKEMLLSWWDTIKNTFTKIAEIFGLDKVIEKLKTGFLDAWETAKEKLFGWVASVKESFSEFADAMSTFFSDLVDGLQGVFIKAWDSAKDYLSGWISSMKEGFSEFFESILGFFKRIVEELGGGFAQAWDGAKSMLSSWIEAVKNAFAGFVDAIVKFFGNIIGTLKGDFATAWNAAQEMLAAWINTIKEAFSGFVESMLKFFGDIAEELKGGFANAWSKAKEMVLSWISALKEALSGFASSIAGVFTEIKDTLQTVFVDAWESAKEAIGKILDTMRSWIASFVDKVTNAFDAVKRFFGVSKDIEGVSGRVEKNIKEAADWLSGIAKRGQIAEQNVRGFVQNIEEAVDAGGDLKVVLEKTMQYLLSGAAKYGQVSEEARQLIFEALAATPYADLLRELGYAIPERLVQGLKAVAKSARDAAREALIVPRTLVENFKRARAGLLNLSGTLEDVVLQTVDVAGQQRMSWQEYYDQLIKIKEQLTSLPEEERAKIGIDETEFQKALRAIEQIQAYIDALPEELKIDVAISGPTLTELRQRLQLVVPGKQAGGPVPGTGRGDKVLALLEPGEFVVPRWMMRIPQIRDLLLSVWARGYQKGGPVQLAPGSGGGVQAVSLRH